MMQEKGLEPSRCCHHTDLNRARLPIPPLLRTICILHYPGRKVNRNFQIFSKIFIVSTKTPKYALSAAKHHLERTAGVPTSTYMFPFPLFWLIRPFHFDSKFFAVALRCNEGEKQPVLLPLKFHSHIYISYKTWPALQGKQGQRQWWSLLRFWPKGCYK